jgi:hypothetical protein
MAGALDVVEVVLSAPAAAVMVIDREVDDEIDFSQGMESALECA